jgi:thiamine biosynthesis lipoprotein
MGMPIVLDIPKCRDEQVFKDAFTELVIVDRQFSPYKPESELSQLRVGKLSPHDASIGMKEVMRGCLEWEDKTDGYFSARYGDSFDPTGYVKGWAISELATKIRKWGFETFCLSAGGDVLASSTGVKVWKIGLQHPVHRSQLIGTVAATNMAVATSGNYERGNHIINPKSGEPATYFTSLTVAGHDMITADVLATAAYAMGKRGLKYIDAQPGYEVMAVDTKGVIYVSTGMKALLDHQ